MHESNLERIQKLTMKLVAHLPVTKEEVFAILKPVRSTRSRPSPHSSPLASTTLQDENHSPHTAKLTADLLSMGKELNEAHGMIDGKNTEIASLKGELESARETHQALREAMKALQVAAELKHTEFCKFAEDKELELERQIIAWKKRADDSEAEISIITEKNSMCITLAVDKLKEEKDLMEARLQVLLEENRNRSKSLEVVSCSFSTFSPAAQASQNLEISSTSLIQIQEISLPSRPTLRLDRISIPSKSSAADLSTIDKTRLSSSSASLSSTLHLAPSHTLVRTPRVLNPQRSSSLLSRPQNPIKPSTAASVFPSFGFRR